MTSVVLVADGDAAIGAGHLVRTGAIAHACRALGVDVLMATRHRGALHAFAWGDLPTVDVPAPTIDAAIAHLRQAHPTARLVIDHYEARDLTDAVVLDDGLPRDLSRAALVVDTAPGVHPQDHPTVPFVGGAPWAPLRPAFAAGPGTPPADGPWLVALGATDILGGLPALVQALGSRPMELLCAHDPGLGLPVHRGLDAPALVALLRRCRAAVVSASTISLEAAALGVPLIAVQTADNQARVAAGLRAASVPVFPAGAWADIAAATPVAAHLGDGRGAERIARRVLEPRLPDLRPATWADADLLLAWANDPGTRAASFTTAPIAREDHLRWLAGSLFSPTRRLFIGWADGVPMGTVRLDDTAEGAVVGITVAPEQRGRGRGHQLLALLRTWATGQVPRLVAWVRHDNPASLKLFRAAGYRPVRDDLVNGHAATCYHCDL